ncbi:MAG: DsrE family protein [Campylobacterota bacterium]|nr:DsrE family protein [Campylobacterota bacterium]
MKKLLTSMFLSMILSVLAFADGKDPLFVNLTTDSEHRALMAVQFSSKMMSKDHPLTLYLNDKGVVLASTKNARYSQIQSKLEGIIKNGGAVYICPVCMKEYRVEGSELVKGIKLGNAKLLEKALFKDDTKTLSW